MTIDFVGSPNFGKRNKPVTKIICHWFGSGTLESADARFQNPNNKVSAHYGISRGRVWQWVSEYDVAWHCGVASVNAESIGIEHDSVLNGHKLSALDYQNSGRLIFEIAQRHNIPLDRKHILKHSEVKATQCCGTVDVDKLISIAKQFNSINETSMIIKEKSKPALYAAIGDVLIPFTNYEKFLKDFDPARIIEVDSAQIKKFKISKDNLIT